MSTILTPYSYKNERVEFSQINSQLHTIKRFHEILLMHFRATVHEHQRYFVPSIVYSLIPALTRFTILQGIEFNPDLAMAEAFRHDDTEIITGDDALAAKLKWNPKQRGAKKIHQWNAIHDLVGKFPENYLQFNYRKLLEADYYKKTFESQVVSYADKIVGLCESIHELVYGNTLFIEPVLNYYIHTFNEQSLVRDFPLLQPLFVSKHEHPFFTIHRQFIGRMATYAYENNVTHASPHWRNATAIPFYEEYKKVLVEVHGVKLEELLFVPRE